MMTDMIATASFLSEMEKIQRRRGTYGPNSVMSRNMTDVRRWHNENPKDWTATRGLTKDKYCKFANGQDWRESRPA